jgi:hypothetical protein
MTSTRGLPTDLCIEAMESVASHVMLSIKSMQYEAQRQRGEIERTMSKDPMIINMCEPRHSDQTNTGPVIPRGGLFIARR